MRISVTRYPNDSLGIGMGTVRRAGICSLASYFKSIKKAASKSGLLLYQRASYINQRHQYYAHQDC